MEINGQLMHNMVNALIMPVVLVCVFFTLPPLFIYRSLLSIYGHLAKENVRGKVVVITGASSGIGEEMAYEYAKRGARLVTVARREKKLKEVAERARKLGSPDVLAVCADVSMVDDCKRFIDLTINQFGRLDHLVNNAGIASVFPVEDATDITKLAPVMDINFWGSVYPTYFAIPHLKRSKGKILFNSSSSALLNPPTMSFYAASKAALLSWCEALRVELGPSVSMTVATLGFIESEMTQGKVVSKEGMIQADKQLLALDAVKGIPMMGTRACAEAMVEAVIRNEKYVIEPRWYNALIIFKTFCPELIDCFYRYFFFTPKTQAYFSSSSN